MVVRVAAVVECCAGDENCFPFSRVGADHAVMHTSPGHRWALCPGRARSVWRRRELRLGRLHGCGRCIRGQVQYRGQRNGRNSDRRRRCADGRHRRKLNGRNWGEWWHNTGRGRPGAVRARAKTVPQYRVREPGSERGLRFGPGLQGVPGARQLEPDLHQSTMRIPVLPELRSQRGERRMRTSRVRHGWCVRRRGGRGGRGRRRTRRSRSALLDPHASGPEPGVQVHWLSGLLQRHESLRVPLGQRHLHVIARSLGRRRDRRVRLLIPRPVARDV
jgi:hypothetical protein